MERSVTGPRPNGGRPDGLADSAVELESGQSTLGVVLLRSASRAGYGGPAAWAYVLGRLGQPAPAALLHEPVPSTWSDCEVVAERHGLRATLLWNLLLEERA
jgi:hypothetical protein